MSEIKDVLDEFDKNSREENKHIIINFSEFLSILQKNPRLILRDIFQLIHDMVHYYVPGGIDEYPNDPESIRYVKYDFYRLFIKGSDNPFFADRLFANRFMNLMNSFNHVADRNKIYFFEGPPGSGKSTFLKNFLYRFERYMKTDQGEFYETHWKIDKAKFMYNNEFLLTSNTPNEAFTKKILQAYESSDDKDIKEFAKLISADAFVNNSYVMVPCPNHDHPILQIPKAYRKQLLYDIIPDEEFKQKLFTEKKYKWIFKDEPCTICSSLYETLLDRFGSPMDVLNMIYPKRVRFNRRLGEGISVYNPGDELLKKPIVNPALQTNLDGLFGDSNRVKYIHSELAKTNNGIFVIMDVKRNNKDRVLNLHGVISDGVHKVESFEENINTFFIGLINPQDKEFIEKTKSLQDRIIYIKMPYILDYTTEVQIYMKNFGNVIASKFLPYVLENFSRVIIASRLNKESIGLKEWIGDPNKYSKFCDPDLLLLKMDIYGGSIPEWISEEDRRKFRAKLRKKILKEGEIEGIKGITGRESLHIFNEFYSLYSKTNKLINMEMVYNFFTKHKKEYSQFIPVKFLDSLVSSYDYTILQQVKESLYSFNKSRISKNLQNYIFAVNFDIGSVEKCKYTGQVIEITETYLKSMEDMIIGTNISLQQRKDFRHDVLQKYISKTVNEITLDKKKITQTELYKDLYEKYTRNLKNNVLDPFLKNENFRNGIKEYHTKEFATHDKKIKKDVSFLIHNLMRKYLYTEEGAKEVCIYVIDKALVNKFQD